MIVANNNKELLVDFYHEYSTDKSCLSYAYPCSNVFEDIMSSSIVKNTLRAVSKKYCHNSIEQVLSKGRFVNENSFPRLFSITKSCCKVLAISNCPSVMVSPNLKGINALSVLSEDIPVILVSRKASASLSDNELSFMLGHELGHILQGNLVCHTLKGLLDNIADKSELLGPILANLIDVPLNEWYRCSEYTADRAGYLCCKSISDIVSIFNKINEINLKTNYYSYIELYKLHPFVNSRIEQIKVFAKELSIYQT